MDTLESINYENLKRTPLATMVCPSILNRIAEYAEPDVKTCDRYNRWCLLYATHSGNPYSIIAVYNEDRDGFAIYCKCGEQRKNICELMKANDYKYTDENFIDYVYDFVVNYIMS